jgi:hypothetical protein
MKIVIDTTPHADQRYPTVGDWWVEDDGTWHIRVSDMGDWRYELLVALHELVEFAICQHEKVSEQEITAFDVAFEKRRPEGNVDEPGDEPAAPYQREHCIATGVERIVAALLGVKWKEYDEKVNSL